MELLKIIFLPEKLHNLTKQILYEFATIFLKTKKVYYRKIPAVVMEGESLSRMKGFVPMFRL